MSDNSPTALSLRGRIAADTRWSRITDRTAATASARAGLDRRFAAEIDPDGQLSPAELEKRLVNARRAHFTRLALKSAESRRKAKELTAAADDAEQQLHAVGGAA